MGATTRAWRTIAQRVRLERRPCWLCGRHIDYTLQWPNRWSYSCDHRVPTFHGGSDTYDNAEAAHLHCNTSRQAGLLRASVAATRTDTH